MFSAKATTSISDSQTTERKAFSAQTWISATFILVFTTLLSKALGFVRDILVARYFGASAEVDAFMVAVTLPTLVGGIGFALSTAFIPVYRKVLAYGDPRRGRRLAGGAVGVTLAVSGFLMMAIIMFARPLVGWLAPGLASPTAALAVQLARVLSPLVLGLNLFYMLGAIYNALEHFKIPAYTDMASNILVIGSIVLLSSVMGIKSLALGMITGSLLVVIVMAIPIVLKRVMLFALPPVDTALREIVVLATPVLVIEVLSQTVAVVENFFGAKLGPGNIAALGFAKRLTVILVSLLAINIARAVFPVLSKLVSERNLASAKDLFVKLIRQYALVFIPLSIALMYFRDDVIRIAYVRGAFGPDAAAKTSAAFLYYSAGLALAAAISIFMRACYAFSDTLVPLKAAMLQLAVMAGLNLLLTPRLGLIGIALSTSLALLPALVWMGVSLARRFGGIELGPLLRTVTLALACSITALVPVAAFGRVMGPTPRLSVLVLETMLYAVSYFGIGWIVMRHEIRTLWSLLRRAA